MCILFHNKYLTDYYVPRTLINNYLLTKRMENDQNHVFLTVHAIKFVYSYIN